MLIHKRIFDLIRGVEPYILIKSLFGTIISASFIAQALVMGQLIGQLYTSQSLDEVQANLLILAFILLARMVLIWIDHIYGKWIVGKIKYSLRGRLYQKLLKLGPGYLTDNRTGHIESTVVAGVNYLEGYFNLYIPQVLVCLVTSSAIIALILYIHPVLGLLCLVTAIAALFAPVLFIRVISKRTEQHWGAYINLNAEFVDVIQGMRTLKSYNAAERTGHNLSHKMTLLFNKTMQSLRVNLSEISLSNFATALGSSFTLALGAYYTAKGDIDIEQLSILLFLTKEVFRPISQLAGYFHQGFMGMTSADGIVDILDERVTVNDHSSTIEWSEAAPVIDFSGIDFSYNKSAKRIFSHLNLKVSAGQSLAIVGESGSGKTSLMRLLLRYYDVDRGKILYQQNNIKDLPLDEFRKHIALVSQESYLFNGSIAFNLRLAKPDATMEEMIRVCQDANIHSDIAVMPNGYQTQVGEMGMGLSGGQRQRLAIARALLKDTPLVVLDEPTSSVDVESEILIKESLEKLFKDKTTITIAHRLSTIRDADKIVVLDQGKIVESGRHDELMANQSIYYKLIQAQEEGGVR